MKPKKLQCQMWCGWKFWWTSLQCRWHQEKNLEFDMIALDTVHRHLRVHVRSETHTWPPCVRFWFSGRHLDISPRDKQARQELPDLSLRRRWQEWIIVAEVIIIHDGARSTSLRPLPSFSRDTPSDKGDNTAPGRHNRHDLIASSTCN